VTISTLASGFGLLEGPRAAPDGSIYFSDTVNGGVRRVRPDGEVEVVIPKRRGVGGIALHADGGLVVSGKNICHSRDGANRILFELADAAGFNDIFTDAQGRIYCGTMRDDPMRTEGERTPGEAYRIDAQGSATMLYRDVRLTNGIGFSPDGRRLYHVDSTRGVLVHDVGADGTVDEASGRLFGRPRGGVADGLAVDTDGGVWVAVFGAGCVTRLTPDGSIDRSIRVPATGVTSLCFAGAGLEEMIVVTADNTEDPSRAGTVFHLTADEVGATGVPAPLARV
jgi:gluconolactonase